MTDVVTDLPLTDSGTQQRSVEKSKLKRLVIVVRDDAYDRLYTPLTFAYVAAMKGVQVDMLFVLWAVRVLTGPGADAVKIDSQHASEDDWFRKQLRREGDPASIRVFLRLIHRTGKVNFYGCRLAAATFDVDESQLIDEASGIADALWFLEEKAMQADHCQYF